MWTKAVSGKKKLLIQKFPDTCGRGLKLRDLAPLRKVMQLYQLGCKFLDVSFLSHFYPLGFFFLFHIQEHNLSDPMELLFHSFMEEGDLKYWRNFLSKTNFYARLGESKIVVSTNVQKYT